MTGRQALSGNLLLKDIDLSRAAPRRIGVLAAHDGLVLEAEGLDQVFKDAGFEWHESACGFCGHIGDDRFANLRVISTTNRNFKGRQGPLTRTHLASPATVAASAIAGCITMAPGGT